MPRTSPARSAPARTTSSRKPARAAPEAEKRAGEPRGVRRKRETRSRLMRAAMQLMAERGVDGVAINEITEAADVGFGSFYNGIDRRFSFVLQLNAPDGGS